MKSRWDLTVWAVFGRIASNPDMAQPNKLAGGLSPHSTRLIMLGVVSAAAIVGFLSSVVLLWAGLRYMPVRYALACFAGYAVFLSLMNRWVGHQSNSWLLDRVDDSVNVLDPSDVLIRGGSRSVGRAAENVFAGGRSGGGGASAAFDAGGVAPPAQPLPIFTSSNSRSGSGKGLSLDLDADDAMPLLAIAAMIAVAVACIGVIWQAPQMLAELLADGAVAGAAYKGLRASKADWTLGVMRRTWLPATAVLVIFVLLGVAGHQLQPGADSIGDFFR
jgi:hypothetical protein